MLKITANEIYLTRGDSADIVVTIYDMNGDVYSLQPDDVLLFTIKRNCITDDIIIQKDITSDSTIHIIPTDTNNLDYGVFKFDVQLTMASGDIYTVIDPHDFNLTKEVTF